MFDKCMEELSSDFPAGCKNELEIESSTKIGTCQNPSKLTVVCTNYSCQSTCRSVLSNVHLKPGRFFKSLHVYSSCSFSQNMQCVLCSWHVPVALAAPSCSLCCSAGSWAWQVPQRLRIWCRKACSAAEVRVLEKWMSYRPTKMSLSPGTKIKKLKMLTITVTVTVIIIIIYVEASRNLWLHRTVLADTTKTQL